MLYIYLIQYLFSRLFYGIVIDLHLFRKVFFQPFVLLYVVVDELDGKLSVYLNG